MNETGRTQVKKQTTAQKDFLTVTVTKQLESVKLLSQILFYIYSACTQNGTYV